MRDVLVVSDVHLAPLARSAGAWMAYRRPERAVDAHLAAAIDRAVTQAGGRGIDVVLGGDFLDLDAPLEDAPDLDARAEPGALHATLATLRDHPIVFLELARSISRGARVVFVPGNHDAQLAFPAVRLAVAQALGVPYGDDRRLRFAAWFHRVDGVHVEHGHVYDPFCTMSRLHPALDACGTARLEPTLGTVGTRAVGELLGLVNPYGSDPLKDVSGRLDRVAGSLVGSPHEDYLARSAAIVRDLAGVETDAGARAVSDDRWLRSVSGQTGADLGKVALHRYRWASKASAGDLADAALDPAYGYDRDTDERLRGAMGWIGRLHQADVVVMGHTHRAFAERRPDGRAHANSGTWAPLERDDPRAVVGTAVRIVGNHRRQVWIERTHRDGSVS